MSTTRHDQYQRCVSVTELAFVSGAKNNKKREPKTLQREEENGKEGNG